LVNSVIAAGKPFICCPEPRPFDEQVAKARGLQACGAAIVIERWPMPERWPALLAEATQLDRKRLAALGDPDGAANLLALLETFANGQK
jgi:UDP-N-acetylglucosamine:LPS N-acetylglucosamine transferase